MVRLGESLNKWAYIFQKVSIPVWFDWEGFERLTKEEFEHVSIPVWFDWEAKKTVIKSLLSKVSIPVWFDWEAANLPRLKYTS